MRLKIRRFRKQHKGGDGVQNPETPPKIWRLIMYIKIRKFFIVQYLVLS